VLLIFWLKSPPCRVSRVLNLLSQGGRLADAWALAEAYRLNIGIDTLRLGVGSKRDAPSRARQVISVIPNAQGGVKAYFLLDSLTTDDYNYS
jgi:hypothetical protein